MALHLRRDTSVSNSYTSFSSSVINQFLSLYQLRKKFSEVLPPRKKSK